MSHGACVWGGRAQSLETRKNWFKIMSKLPPYLHAHVGEIGRSSAARQDPRHDCDASYGLRRPAA